MVDTRQIPYMLELLNDETPNIRKVIIDNLTSFGPLLKRELQKSSYSLNSYQKQVLREIFAFHKENHIKCSWPFWMNLNSECTRLEKAVTVLSDYLDEGNDSLNIKNELNKLAKAYWKAYSIKDPALLARFLFKELGFVGDEENYYDPQNCNLKYVLKEKKGIPISLVTLYMLIGNRLGIPIEGCNFPGHFLARVYHEDRYVLVDCFNCGEIIEREDIFRVKEDIIEGLDNILSEKVNIEVMVRRFLANLIRMFQTTEDDEKRDLMIDLFKRLENHLNDQKIAEMSPNEIVDNHLPKFEAGQIIRHKRYGYRGVIVDFDVQCMASEDWYYSNHTQPNLFQPWYHILVDETEQITYVAEANMVIEDEPKEIVHPLVDYFFSGLILGKYIRNENPWPETEY